MPTQSTSSRQIDFVPVPSAQVFALWDRVAPLIADALKPARGRLTADDCLHACLVRDMQLWTAQHEGAVVGCAVTEIVNFPRMRTCRYVAVAGMAGPEWLGLSAKVEDWARQNGCEKMEGYARKGWERHARHASDGWNVTGVIIEKDL